MHRYEINLPMVNLRNPVGTCIRDSLDLKELGWYTCRAKMPISIKIKIPPKATDATPSIPCSRAPSTQSIDLTCSEPECNEAPVPSPLESSGIGDSPDRVSQNDQVDAVTDLGELKLLSNSKGLFIDIITCRDS